MQVHQCSTGQRVFHKESGKIATIRRIFGNSGELELAFENGTTTQVHARLVEPADLSEVDAPNDGPLRPCPQCAAKMSITLTVCPSCGFKYGVKQSKPSHGLLKFLVIAAVLIPIAYWVWKYVIPGRHP